MGKGFCRFFPRGGLLQRCRDREDAVDADNPVDHRRTDRREVGVQHFAGGRRDGRAYGFRRPLQPRRRARVEPREGLEQFGDVVASEVRGHALVAHGVLGPPHDLAHRVDQECLGEAPDLGDRRNLPGQLALGGTFARTVFTSSCAIVRSVSSPSTFTALSLVSSAS